MTLAQETQRYTPADYYRLEVPAEYKSDYYDGEIIAWPHLSCSHSLICVNLIGEVGQALRRTPWIALQSGMRLKVQATGLRTYPDLSVYGVEREFDTEGPPRETITNPTVIFEVLSRTNELYDRHKASHYRKIESLRALVLVSEEVPRVERYLRQPNERWEFLEIEGLDKTLSLAVIGVDLKLSEIYSRIDFPN